MDSEGGGGDLGGDGAPLEQLAISSFVAIQEQIGTLLNRLKAEIGDLNSAVM
eukprot:gene32592-41424_t